MEQPDNAERLAAASSELMAVEYDIRTINNELFDIMNGTEIGLDDLRRIDELQAQKAKLILDAHNQAYPTALATLRAMASAIAEDDIEEDIVEQLQHILADIVQERQHLSENEPSTQDRYDELTTLITTIERILVASVTERRYKTHMIDELFGTEKAA